MQSGLYVSLSSQMALEKRLTTIADNMANVNTTGFRGTEVKFNQILSNTDNKLNAGALRSVGNRRAVVERDRQRLFDQQLFAVPRRKLCVLRMELMRCCNIDGLDLRIGA